MARYRTTEGALDYLLLLGDVFHSCGGLQDFNRNLLLALSRLDFRCVALLLNDDNVPAGFTPNLRLVPCGGAPGWRKIWKLRLVLIALFACFRQRPGCIICGHVNLLPVCELLRTATGVDYIVVTHGFEIWGPHAKLPERALANARLVLSVSRYTRQYITDRVPRAKVELICNTVDPERFTPGPRSERLLARHGLRGRHVLLTVGRLSSQEQYKGHEIVFQALPTVLQEFPNTVYVILGSGDDQERLRTEAGALGIEEHVVFAGFVPDSELVEYYNLCDVFVMPSKGEGFGIVYLEALACGKPVVAGDQDGSLDALLDGRLGLLVNPDSATDVAAALTRVLSGKVDAKLLDPEYLRGEVLRHFGPQSFQDRIAQVLRGNQSAEGALAAAAGVNSAPRKRAS